MKNIFITICLIVFQFSQVVVAEDLVLRIGHFPNLTHAQALILHNSTRAGDGILEKNLGPNIKVEWYTYNAGPSAMEAIIADSIDISYVGPNPAMNAFIRSEGKALKVISGSAKGGAGLVLRNGVTITTPTEFRGKTIATPQLGNTQDISARAYFKSLGFNITQLGGDVRILPVANADHLIMMTKGEIDGAWTVEPWLSRLQSETGASLYKEDADVLTTVIAASSKALSAKSELIAKFLKVHAEVTNSLSKNRSGFYETINNELKFETTKGIQKELFDRAIPRITFSTEIKKEDFNKALTEAKISGLSKETDSVEGIL